MRRATPVDDYTDRCEHLVGTWEGERKLERVREAIRRRAIRKSPQEVADILG